MKTSNSPNGSFFENNGVQIILKFFAVGCILVIVLFFGTFFSSEVLVDDIYYNFISTDSTAIVTSHGRNGKMYGEYTDTVTILPTVFYKDNTYTVTDIDHRTFCGCDRLYSVKIPNTVTIIGYEAFYKCNNLSTVVMGSGISQVRVDAFAMCSNLSTVYYCGTVKDWCKIEFENERSNPLYYAHDMYIDEKQISSLFIPADVDIINNYVFPNNKTFDFIVCEDSVPPVIFTNTFNRKTAIYVPESGVNAYKSAPYWEYLNIRSVQNLPTESDVRILVDL